MKLHFLGALAMGALLFHCSGSDKTTPVGPTDDAGVDEETGPEDEDSGPQEGTCPKVSTPKTIGTVSSSAITEASGLVASKKNPGYFWVHNDSGDSARGFAIAEDGSLKTILAFDDKKPSDIEDMTIDDTGSSSYLYFGDIGDNEAARKSITIHRVLEPTLGDAELVNAVSEKMTVTYEDGPHNAETLMFDPIDKELFIATKILGGPSYIHRLGEFKAGESIVTTKIATVDVDFATGGDISRDGRYIAIRSSISKKGSLWIRDEGQSLAEAFAKDPCVIPLATETQGETLAFLVDNSGYVTISEGEKQSLHLALFQ